MVIGKGFADKFLSESEARAIFAEGLATLPVDGKRVLVIMPDSTRSGPIPMVFRTVNELLKKRAGRVDWLIALGTHQPMTPEHRAELVGAPYEPATDTFAGVHVYNHNFETDIKKVGTIPAARIKELSGGLMEQDVDVTVNPRLFDYDQLIIVGPVFPHEVAGFSGGLKYFFPGVSGPDVTNFTHWLGAVITNVNIIGTLRTPVRQVIEEASKFITTPAAAFCMVVRGKQDLAGLYFGTPVDAQAAAAALSAQVHVVYIDHPVKTVLSVMPELYDDIWTAAKGMYKMEPVVADGGTVIIYAPHIDEVSYTHGKVLDRIGYHVRDYFLKQMDKFADVPGGVMAHSTHVKGAGTFEDGVETPRVNVILATGVPKERCDKINLGYMDPAEIDVDEWMARQDPDLLVIPRAGEMLYRLKSSK
jgi:nickel-dependent lactate racemase